jgi:hypothetical protein
MYRLYKAWVTVLLTLVCSGWVTLAYGYWSQEWSQNFPPEDVGAFTKMEFFIMPGASPGVTFAAPSSILPVLGSSSTGWTSTIPNSAYSLLTGPPTDTAYVTTFFSGPSTATFTLDFVLWDGNSVIERQAFKWVGGSWQNQQGSLLLSATGGYSAGQYNRSEETIPIPSTVLLFVPAGLGVLLVRRRIGQNSEGPHLARGIEGLRAGE